ncbi:MAG: hypothetical protein ABI130_11970 [Leifsonia sp.]
MNQFATLVIALTGGLSLSVAVVAALFLREFVILPIQHIAHDVTRRVFATFVAIALVAMLTWIFLAPVLLLRPDGQANAILVLPWIAAIPILTIGLYLAHGIGRVATVALLVVVSGGIGAAVASLFEQADDLPHTASPTIAFVIVLSAVVAFIWWANTDTLRSTASQRPQSVHRLGTARRRARNANLDRPNA